MCRFMARARGTVGPNGSTEQSFPSLLPRRHVQQLQFHLCSVTESVNSISRKIVSLQSSQNHTDENSSIWRLFFNNKLSRTGPGFFRARIQETLYYGKACQSLCYAINAKTYLPTIKKYASNQKLQLHDFCTLLYIFSYVHHIQ